MSISAPDKFFMAKQQRSIKQTNIRNHGSIGSQLEHTEVFDDNLLPEALEIERLKLLDPDIMFWLKSRGEREQDFRHKAYLNKLSILKFDMRSTRMLNVLGLCFAFLIFCIGMGFSYFLLMQGKQLEGTLFGGSTLFLGITLFITRSLPPKNKKPEN